MSGNLWMFSDMLDDEDIEMQKHDFITLYQGADYYGLGLKVFTRMAREAGSVYKIGKKALIRRTIFDEYLRKVYKKELEKNSSDDSGTESAEDGTFKFEKIPYGTWVVREIEPAVGFVLNEKAYQITIQEDGDVVEIKLENRYICGDIEGLKLDEDGNVIAGAKFGLFKPGTTEFTEETAVLVTESDSEGKFRFEDIRFGLRFSN